MTPACEDKHTHTAHTTEPPQKIHLLLNARICAHSHGHSHTLRPTVWALTAFRSAFPFTVEKSTLWPGVFSTLGKEAARECHASALTKWEEDWIDAHHLCVSTAFILATSMDALNIHYVKLFSQTGNAIEANHSTFQTSHFPAALQSTFSSLGILVSFRFFGLKLCWFISPSSVVFGCSKNI